MASFQKTVLWVAIIIFICLMVLIAVMMNSAKSTMAFPPQIGACPDYWQKLLDGTCQNVQGLGNECGGPIDFNKPEYQGNEGLKKKCKFAKGCGIEWDGITNQDPSLCR